MYAIVPPRPHVYSIPILPLQQQPLLPQLVVVGTWQEKEPEDCLGAGDDDGGENSFWLVRFYGSSLSKEEQIESFALFIEDVFNLNKERNSTNTASRKGIRISKRETERPRLCCRFCWAKTNQPRRRCFGLSKAWTQWILGGEQTIGFGVVAVCGDNDVCIP